MPLYKIQDKKISALQRTTFAEQKLRERDDLQAMLKNQIDIISPETLVVSEEFGEWEDSKRRIDLLGIDKAANLVVIELKRTEGGGHMELQAIRYAAMISNITFDELANIYDAYLKKNEINKNAQDDLLEFLEWSEPNEDEFAQEVRIVLAGADFSKELTSSVMWLNDFNVNIRCVRLHPYVDDGETYIDVQTVIPLPEVADYQIKVRDKKQKEREARSSNRDFTKYDLNIAGNEYPNLSKRWLMFHVVSNAINSGCHPNEMSKVFPSRKFKVFDGELNQQQVYDSIMQDDKGGVLSRADRFFVEDDEFFYVDGKTYVLSNQWGKQSLSYVAQISELFPNLKISITPFKD